MTAVAQPRGTHYDESKVPPFTLPDPLVHRHYFGAGSRADHPQLATTVLQLHQARQKRRARVVAHREAALLASDLRLSEHAGPQPGGLPQPVSRPMSLRPALVLSQPGAAAFLVALPVFLLVELRVAAPVVTALAART